MLFKTRPNGAHPGSGRTPLVDNEGRQIVILESSTSGDDLSGAKISAATMPTGGTGLLGWLSAIWYTLRGGENGYISNPTVTRAANTTPYSIGDVVGGVIEFTTIGPAGGQVMVTAIDIQAYIAAVPSGLTNLRLQLYNATPPSAYADNAAWDLPSGDRASYLGYIDSALFADLGSTCYAQADWVNKQFKLASGQTSLWGYLVTPTAFTPAGNSEVYVPRLRAVGL